MVGVNVNTVVEPDDTETAADGLIVPPPVELMLGVTVYEVLLLVELLPLLVELLPLLLVFPSLGVELLLSSPPPPQAVKAKPHIPIIVSFVIVFMVYHPFPKTNFSVHVNDKIS